MLKHWPYDSDSREVTKGTLETALCHIACLLGVGKRRERGRAHSLLANSIQKDADSRSEVS